jgi:hypothetical protein
MKTKKRPTSFAFLILILIAFGCQNDEKPSDRSSAKDETESEITLVERELGIQLHFRDLVLTDEGGENKITLRVASTNESMLNEYLRYRTFSIEPIFQKEETDGSIDLRNAPKVLNNSAKLAGDFDATVITEVINQDLKSGVRGVRLHNKYNTEYKADKSGRTKYYFLTTHTSNNWPSYLNYQSFSYTQMQMDYKQKWYSSWFPVYGPESWCCYDFYEFHVDGPYRVRIWVEYNFESDYYHVWIY